MEWLGGRIHDEQEWLGDAREVLRPWTDHCDDSLHPELNYESGAWRDVFMNFLGGYYGPLHKQTFGDDVRVIRLRHLVDNVLSMGGMPRWWCSATLRGTERKAWDDAMHEVRSIVERAYPGKGDDDHVEVSMAVDAYWCKLIEKDAQ